MPAHRQGIADYTLLNNMKYFPTKNHLQSIVCAWGSRGGGRYYGPETQDSQHFSSKATQAFSIGAGESLTSCYILFTWLLLFHPKESTGTQLQKICQRLHCVAVVVLRGGPDPKTLCSIQL